MMGPAPVATPPLFHVKQGRTPLPIDVARAALREKVAAHAKAHARVAAAANKLYRLYGVAPDSIDELEDLLEELHAAATAEEIANRAKTKAQAEVFSIIYDGR